MLLAGIAAAIIGVVLPINQLTQPGASVPVTLADPQDGVVSPDGLPEGSSLQLAGSGDTVDLQVAELPVALRALSEAPTFVSGLLALAGAWLLRRILVEIAAGRPFAPVVSRRLAGLAVVAVATSFVPSAVGSLATVVTLEHLGHARAGIARRLPGAGREPVRPARRGPARDLRHRLPARRRAHRGRGGVGLMSPVEVDTTAGHRVTCHLDDLLAARDLTLRELADRVGVTVVNLSVLKNDRAKAIRFSTLTAICDVLGCQPGELFSVNEPPATPQPRGSEE